MAYFEWKSEIETGHPQIDEQHKRLFVLAEAVVEPLFSSEKHQAREEALQALIDFTRRHFAYEEALMKSAGYPEERGHKLFHSSLLIELEAYRDKVCKGDNTNPVGLIGFLWNWLIMHIHSADRQLVSWIKTRDQQGQSQQ